MSTGAQFRYCWAARPGVNVPDGWEQFRMVIFSVGDRGQRIESMAEPGDQMPAWAWELLQVAVSAYVQTRKAPDTAADN